MQLGNQPPLADAQRRQALREDIDRLLDRRLYLEMVREGSARVGSKPDQRANPQPYQSTAPGP